MDIGMLFDIEETMFTIFNYNMSYLEFWATIFGLWCVWLTAKNKILCWVIGIVNVVGFFILFYQVQLYSDMLLQVYFLIASLYGWWKWTHPDEDNMTEDSQLKVTTYSNQSRLIGGGIVLGVIVVWGYFMKDIHNILPKIFPFLAVFPIWDSGTTVMSVVAQWIMAKKKLESWVLWIIVDVICVIMYYQRGIIFMSLEYFIFLIIAISGLIKWYKIREDQI